MTRTGENRNTYRMLMGKPEGKNLLRRFDLKWEDNIKIDLIAVGWEVMGRIHLAQDNDKWQDAVKININSRVR
jgi:hypothetical protein